MLYDGTAKYQLSPMIEPFRLFDLGIVHVSFGFYRKMSRDGQPPNALLTPVANDKV
jgi:hypothetical protein